jgi:hypothetical protein
VRFHQLLRDSFPLCHSAMTHSLSLSHCYGVHRIAGTEVATEATQVQWEPGARVEAAQLRTVQLRPLRQFSVGDVVAWRPPLSAREAAAAAAAQRASGRYGVGAQLGWKLQLLVRTGHQTQALPAHMRHNAPVEGTA